VMRPTQARTTRRNLVRSSGERFEEEEEVRSKSITGGHCIVWEWFFGQGGDEGSLLSKDSANSQSRGRRGWGWWW